MQDWCIAETTELSVEEATRRVESAAAEKGLRVLTTHDVAQTLRDKGFESGEYRIVEVCNAKLASRAIGIDPRVGLWMPCPIAVYEDEGKTCLATVRTTMLSQFFPGPQMAKLGSEIEKLLIEVIKEAKKE